MLDSRKKISYPKGTYFQSFWRTKNRPYCFKIYSDAAGNGPFETPDKEFVQCPEN